MFILPHHPEILSFLEKHEGKTLYISTTPSSLTQHVVICSKGLQCIAYHPSPSLTLTLDLLSKKPKLLPKIKFSGDAGLAIDIKKLIKSTPILWEDLLASYLPHTIFSSGQLLKSFLKKSCSGVQQEGYHRTRHYLDEHQLAVTHREHNNQHEEIMQLHHKIKQINKQN
ncbi:hypothetical protein MMH89_01560 [Candidatus Comchoanobacter bicostacola]|uniref:Uncharacterized protein n=1 Tax=Candidatus Comchoanobacter bicostacola TaxID=2919598 RepID=A0ABY5DK27_9GAMM|nr:hypothetical protein [Candidatus Comchoanobacter bicostacola]UTC24838.1 hypothetical protein MMH89_01560 [Candidatus Comchoanobacter bicostacola]